MKKINDRSIQTIDAVIFGAVDKSSAINLLIILAKEYIVKCKLAPESITPTEQGLVASINHYVDIERQIAKANDTMQSYSEKWSNMLDEGGQFNVFLINQARDQVRGNWPGWDGSSPAGADNRGDADAEPSAGLGRGEEGGERPHPG